MMNYTESFHLLNKSFNQKDSTATIEKAGLEVRNFSFHSHIPGHAPFLSPAHSGVRASAFSLTDEEIAVNNDFRYSVFLKKGDTTRHRHAILMLHGLNERKWSKYLPWAATLTQKTGIPVVMFPISFHMNRSPEDWSNPRLLWPVVTREVNAGAMDETTSIANYTLSRRLEEKPERFFLSGYQSINDVVALLKSWKKGKNPLFHPDVRVDFFSYSIGAFLTEVLMIANPEGLVDRSRFFLFCGGSVFSGMNATSKFIMNKSSFKRIYQYYVDELENEVIQKDKYAEILSFNVFGRAFRAMITPERFRQVREHTFRKFARQIKAVSLKNDRVIPTREIKDTLADPALGTQGCVEEMDFPFPYTHENPFDVNLTRFGDKIDEGFACFIDKVVAFLGTDRTAEKNLSL